MEIFKEINCLLTCLQVSVQGSTESMRSRWFLSMERWRVWSGVGHGKPGKRGPGRWPEKLPGLPWSREWAVMARGGIWLGSQSHDPSSDCLSQWPRVSVSQVGSGWRLVSQVSLSQREARGNFSHCQCVSVYFEWPKYVGPSRQTPAGLSGFSLYTHIFEAIKEI